MHPRVQMSKRNRIDRHSQVAARLLPGLPPVDSVSMWRVLTAASLDPAADEHPRIEVPVSSGKFLAAGKNAALIVGPYKLLRGLVTDRHRYQDTATFVPLDCSQGCLFNIRQDPGETTDVRLAHPGVHARLLVRAEELDATYFQACSGGPSTDIGIMAEHMDAIAFSTAVARSFFWGPWLPSHGTTIDAGVTSAGGKAWPLIYCTAFHGDRVGCMGQLGRCTWSVSTPLRLMDGGTYHDSVRIAVRTHRVDSPPRYVW